MSETLSLAELRRNLSYSPLTGEFVWLTSGHPQRRAKQWGRAGRLDSKGYRTVSLSGHTFGMNRLAWLYMTGEWPAGHIDHKDCNRDNNAWRNLRRATVSQNIANSGIRRNNQSGWKGVSWHKGGAKWQAHVMANRKNIGLGLFDCPAAAHLAYVVAASQHFGEFARAR